MELNPKFYLRKKLIKWVVLSGIFGSLSLIFDQFAIQQETDIRGYSELNAEILRNDQAMTQYNNAILRMMVNVEDFVTESSMTNSYLHELLFLQVKAELKGDEAREIDALKQKYSVTHRLLVDNIKNFIQEFIIVVESSHQKLYQRGLLNDESFKLIEKIVNTDFNLEQERVLTPDDIDDILLNLIGSRDTLEEVIDYTFLGDDINKPLEYLLSESYAISIKQRYLLLGAIAQIFSLMFLIIFFRNLLQNK